MKTIFFLNLVLIATIAHAQPGNVLLVKNTLSSDQISTCAIYDNGTVSIKSKSMRTTVPLKFTKNISTVSDISTSIDAALLALTNGSQPQGGSCSANVDYEAYDQSIPDGEGGVMGVPIHACENSSSAAADLISLLETNCKLN